MRARSRPQLGMLSVTSELQYTINLTNYSHYRKIARGMDAYQRNTGKQHPLAVGIRTSSNQPGKVPLVDFNNFLWYGNISIGTPPKTFTGKTLLSPVKNQSSYTVSYPVDINTGGSDLFVASANCNKSCSGHKEYDPSASFTSCDLGKNFTLEYNDGFEVSTITTEQYSDVVAIAGYVVRVDISVVFLPRSAHTSP